MPFSPACECDLDKCLPCANEASLATALLHIGIVLLSVAHCSSTCLPQLFQCPRPRTSRIPPAVLLLLHIPVPRAHGFQESVCASVMHMSNFNSSLLCHILDQIVKRGTPT